MNAVVRSLVDVIDRTVHPEVQRRGGMPLLRARMLSLACGLTIPTGAGFLWVLLMNQAFSFRLLFIIGVMAQASAVLFLNRWIRQVTVLAGCSLLFTSLFVALGVVFQARSLIAPGILWFPVLMMPNFLLCGRRVGFIVSVLMTLIALCTLMYCRSYGFVLPFGNDPLTGIRALILTVVLTNITTLGMVAVYFFLLQESEKNSQEQRTWVQRTARMQELLQMSGHFALQTNRPLDVLGTALHNLEDPLKNSLQPRALLPLLEPVESSIRDLAATARSFSLFSRRYLEEGLEQTSVNAILQHVDTIYNVGSALKKARLNWEKVEQDIPIYTQTAKLVMLIISLIRSVASDGGFDITAETQKNAEGRLSLVLRYRLLPPMSKIPKKLDVAPDSDVVFDPELNEDLITELCAELGILRVKLREGDQNIYRLKLPKS